MQANAWWLLALPILFALGWIAAKLDSAQLFTHTRQLPESYFKGLNFLLNEQHEPAIAAFEEVARLDPEIADLYFALGSLFRRRGETERAIRIHRNLLERADLPESARQKALFCLGQDFLNAGIFDRAEAAFNELSGTDYALQAQQALAKLYEKESNWQAAIACLQHYQAQVNSTPTNPIHALAGANNTWLLEDLSHYACELASIQLQALQLDTAQQSLLLAHSSDPKNPRVALYQAQLDCLINTLPSLKQAITRLEGLIEQHPKLTALAIQMLLSTPSSLSLKSYQEQVSSQSNSYEATQDTQGTNPDLLSNNLKATELSILKTNTVSTLQRWAQQTPSAEVVQLLLPLLVALEDTAGQLALLNQLAYQLKQAPQRLSGASVVLGHSLEAIYADHAHVWQKQIWAAMDALVKRYDKPTCKQCGFKASRHHWRCPGCARWNTLPYTAD